MSLRNFHSTLPKEGFPRQSLKRFSRESSDTSEAIFPFFRVDRTSMAVCKECVCFFFKSADWKTNLASFISHAAPFRSTEKKRSFPGVRRFPLSTSLARGFRIVLSRQRGCAPCKRLSTILLTWSSSANR